MTHTAKTLSEMARIRRAIDTMPRSLTELAELLSLPYWKVSRLVRFLVEADRVHVSFQMPHIHAGRPIPFFLAGSKASGERFAQAIGVMRECPCTVAQLAERMGISYTMASRCIASLNSQERIHVAEWAKDGGGMTRVWAAGRGKPATRPARMRTVTDPEVLMQRANQAKAAAIKPFRDPLTAALFGYAE